MKRSERSKAGPPRSAHPRLPAFRHPAHTSRGAALSACSPPPTPAPPRPARPNPGPSQGFLSFHLLSASQNPSAIILLYFPELLNSSGSLAIGLGFLYLPLARRKLLPTERKKVQFSRILASDHKHSPRCIFLLSFFSPSFPADQTFPIRVCVYS